MPMQKQSYQIVGMKQDNLVGTGFSTKFAHEIKNMRLNTIGDYTTGVWTTEKGTKELSARWVESTDSYICSWFPKKDEGIIVVDLSTLQVLGQAVINDQWILFGKITYKDNFQNITTDCILRIFFSKNHNISCEVLYFGNLGFDLSHPIETLPYYENEKIQKVYWTDGLNQPRVINIVKVKASSGFETQFDFAREVALNETVTIKKLQSGTGLFPPCTVKYALTYYDKYGQESNIVYDSPLYYPTKGDRGCSPDELSGDSFEITVTGLDTNFDYIRLYSIVRTSNDATPIVRIVADKEIATLPLIDTEHPEYGRYASFTDTNTTGEIIDPNVLRFLGSRNITAETLDQKSNALFFGNITLKTKSVTNILNLENEGGIIWTNEYDENDPEYNPNDLEHYIEKVSFRTDTNYPYSNQMNGLINPQGLTQDPIRLSSQDLKHFKKGETYTFGLQFQDKYGIWSEVIGAEYLKSTNTSDPELYVSDWYSDIKFYYPRFTLLAERVNTLLDNGYKKARLVYAKKNNSNRQFIAQGVVDSTMYEQTLANKNNNPYRFESWFFRPREVYYDGNRSGEDPIYRHTFGYNNFSRPSYAYILENGNSSKITNYSVEVQNDAWRDQTSTSSSTKKQTWRVDREYMTFHSPELNFDDSLKTLDLNNIDCNIIGYIPIDYSSINWVVSTNKIDIANANYHNNYYFKINDTPFDRYKTHIRENPKNTWHDPEEPHHDYRCDLFPFQNNDLGTNAAYDYKIYSTLLVSKMPILEDAVYETLYIQNNNNATKWKLTNDINRYETSIGESWTVAPWVTSTSWHNIVKDNTNFKVLDKGLQYISLEKDYPNVYSKDTKIIAPNIGEYYIMEWDDQSGTNKKFTVRETSKPISITYKTDTCGLLRTKLPSLKETVGNTNYYIEDYWITWQKTSDLTNFTLDHRPYLWLTEIYRSVSDTEDIKNKIFIPCGPVYTLEKDTTLNIYGLEGDHYFMRYDCLKTFPYSTSDKNQVVEILSFICETRINLDGRYDNKRGLLDNTSVLDTNFNLINKSYTQDNDFFQYTTLEDLSAKLDNFTNQITYTPVKISGEDVDAWTNITLANVDDADGTCGKITKIKNINDKLFLFQEHGIAKIDYDEKTALTTESGIPIELNSTGKYTGIDYITRTVGCQNKWSISDTKNGLFWIDDSRRELLTLDENLTSVTTLNGFDSFMINNCNTKESWNPKTFNNFITHYDKLSKDIYFINNNTCLAWNEVSKTFTSFYDYDNVSALATIDNHTLMFRSVVENDVRKGAIYAAREGETSDEFTIKRPLYSHFFGNFKPYWMTLVCDGSSAQNNNFSLDKVFDTIEYRADIFNEGADISDTTRTNYNNPIFDTKHVWNGYQDSDECALDGIRKFNTWRVQLPRHKGTRDRIRNPFCYIQLKQKDTVQQIDRVILHDLAVSYSIK